MWWLVGARLAMATPFDLTVQGPGFVHTEQLTLTIEDADGQMLMWREKQGPWAWTTVTVYFAQPSAEAHAEWLARLQEFRAPDAPKAVVNREDMVMSCIFEAHAPLRQTKRVELSTPFNPATLEHHQTLYISAGQGDYRCKIARVAP
jgi:hypothetical protein